MSENKYLDQLIEEFDLNSQCAALIDSIIKSVNRELNDEYTRIYITETLNAILTYFNLSRNLGVECNENNNTPEIVYQNKLIITFFKKTKYCGEYMIRELEIGPDMQINIK
jgi:hypothetical protein